jgi:hypothetical protein
MNQKIFKFLVLSITILLVNLFSTLVTDYFMQYKHTTDALRFTAIGMVVIVLVFYPAFNYISGIVEKITVRFLKKGKNIFGRFLGVYFAFAIVLFVLYYIYARIWFHVDVVRVMFSRMVS